MHHINITKKSITAEESVFTTRSPWRWL